MSAEYDLLIAIYESIKRNEKMLTLLGSEMICDTCQGVIENWDPNLPAVSKDSN